jgi:hypothetical protein
MEYKKITRYEVQVAGNLIRNARLNACAPIKKRSTIPANRTKSLIHFANYLQLFPETSREFE